MGSSFSRYWAALARDTLDVRAASPATRLTARCAMPGSQNQFVLISARKSRGGEWSADDYDVRNSHGRAHHASPASTERPAVVLNDNGTRNPTISSQSWIFSDTRTGDGGF
jgi:hypothetical protein